MPSSLPSTEAQAVNFAALAAALSGRKIDRIEPARGGGNNRIFQVIAGDETFALKFYPRQVADRRKRLEQEFGALSFLKSCEIRVVPRAIAADYVNSCALYEWIEGEPVSAVGEKEINAVLSLIAALQEARIAAGAADLPPASASCFSGADVVDQLHQRLACLREIEGDYPELKSFLDDMFQGEVTHSIDRAQAEFAQAGLDFTAVLESGQRVLSPSDFGFHNALRRADGSIVFLDFEYFGWDDPAKELADLLLHPGMPLGEEEKKRLLDGAENIFTTQEKGFTARFWALYPLFALIWCLILLNEYLPERWARRVAAGQSDPEQARARQLERSKSLLDRLIATNDKSHTLI